MWSPRKHLQSDSIPTEKFLAHLVLPGVFSAPLSTFLNSPALVSEHPPGRWPRRRLSARSTPFYRTWNTQDISNSYRVQIRPATAHEHGTWIVFCTGKSSTHLTWNKSPFIVADSSPKGSSIVKSNVRTDHTYSGQPLLLTRVTRHNESLPGENKSSLQLGGRMQQHLFGWWRSFVH